MTSSPSSVFTSSSDKVFKNLFREMNWHAAALFLARIILRPLHPSIGARRIASQTHAGSHIQLTRKGFAMTGLPRLRSAFHEKAFPCQAKSFARPSGGSRKG